MARDGGYKDCDGRSGLGYPEVPGSRSQMARARGHNLVANNHVPCYIGSMQANITEVRSLEADILTTEADLRRRKARLETIRRDCQHVWGDTENADIVRPAYTDPGDPPGSMGIDWRGPQYVPEQRTRRWKRECHCCGLVQYTSEAAAQITEKPVFR